MREFFDRFDSGAYDGISLVVVGLLLVVMTAWHLAISRRNKRAFFAALRTAQSTFEERGAEDLTTQLRVLEALNAWRVWQLKPVPSLEELGDYPTPEEWYAVSLLQSLPDGGSGHTQHVH